MRVIPGLFILFTGASFALAKPVVASTPATAPAGQPQNVDKALEKEISEIDFKKLPLHTAVDFFRAITKTNIVVNWPALALTGITPDTPVTLHLYNVSYELVLRALLEQLPTTKSRANFLVGDNAVEITTTAELGKLAVIRLIDLSQILPASITGPANEKQLADHAEFLKQVVHSELLRAGEEADAPGRSVAIKDNRMIVTQSRRAQLIAQHAIQLFVTPVRIGEHAPGTLLSVQEKRSRQRVAELIGKQESHAALQAIAGDPLKNAPALNVIVLPGTAAELAKSSPDLDYTVDESGLVIIGPTSDIRGRVTLAVYDLRDLLKHMAVRNKQKPSSAPSTSPAPSTLADFTASILDQLKAKVPAGPEKDAQWTEFGKSPTSMTLYEYLLVVSAPAAAHRDITAALQKLQRQ